MWRPYPQYIGFTPGPSIVLHPDQGGTDELLASATGEDAPYLLLPDRAEVERVTVTLAIAHRGDSLGAVENTLAAVLRAHLLGADAVEVDVKATLDGVVVLHHDAELKRLRSHPGAIAQMTFAQLHRLAPDVPTLEKALDAVRDSDVPLVLDVGDTAVAVASYDVARRLGVVGAIWFCGRPSALAAVRALDGDVSLMMTWDRLTAPSHRLVDAVRPTFFNPHHRLLSAGSVRHWHARGVGVSTWTVDDPGRQARLMEWGIDAIISNDVTGVVATVSERRRTRAS